MGMLNMETFAGTHTRADPRETDDGSMSICSLDAGEFRQMLEFMNVMPDRASKTMVMEVFSKAKKHSSDSSELDWPACQWAMQQLAKKMNLPYETLHQLKK